MPFSSVWAQAAEELNEWQQPSYIFKAFKEIALKNEYQPIQAVILKWQTPIRYTFIYHELKPNSLIENLFHTHYQQLSSITGLSIQPALKPKVANVTIHLTPDRLYEQVIKQHTVSKINALHRESHCMGSFKTRNQGEIVQGEIVIPVDHVFSRGLLVSCIVEESTQLMGLPNDSDWVYPSIANDKSKIELLSGLDYLFLKILYHPVITAGMTGMALDLKLKNVIQELANTNEILQAKQTINASGLYPLVNK